MLTVTKSALRAAKACAEPMAVVERHFRSWRDDTEIPLILGFGLVPTVDLIWALRVAEPAAERDVIARLFAADCTERVLPLHEHTYPEDRHPRGAIEVARRFAHGKATPDEFRAATDVAVWASAAAWAATDVAVWASAAATWAAAAWAVATGAWATERRWQTARLRQYLEHGVAAELMECEGWRPASPAAKEGTE